MTSSDILNLIKKKHANDVTVPECKDGPSQATEHLRMDAWVMEKSWSKPNVICYEIKISRADFLRDRKMVDYLPLCNELYIAAPAKLIDKDEVPKDCGLIEVYGSLMRIKKKAPYRKVVIPENVYRYILMCRAKIDRERGYSNHDRAYWEQWLIHKKEDRELGYNVSRTIRQMLQEQVEEVKRENHILKRQIQEYEEIKKFCERLGFKEEDFVSAHLVEGRIKEYNRTVPRSMIWDLERVRDAINSVLEEDKNQVDRLNLQARVVE